MIYEVYLHRKLVKTYKYRLQAVIWCMMHGHVGQGRGYKWLKGDVEIREVSDGQ